MSDFASYLSDPSYDHLTADYSKQSLDIDAFESEIDSLANDPSFEAANFNAPFDNSELLFYLRGSTPVNGISVPSVFTVSSASESPSSDSFSSFRPVATPSIYSTNSLAEELDALDTDMVRLGIPTPESVYSVGLSSYDSDTSSPSLSFSPAPVYRAVSDYGEPMNNRIPTSSASDYYPHASGYSLAYVQATVSPASTNSPSPIAGQGVEDNDPKKKHVCSTCHRAFARQFNLKTHMQTHDPNRAKPFDCKHPGCGRAFSRKHDLMRHLTSLHRTGAQLSEQPTGVANGRTRCDQCGKSVVGTGKDTGCDCDDVK